MQTSIYNTEPTAGAQLVSDRIPGFRIPRIVRDLEVNEHEYRRIASLLYSFSRIKLDGHKKEMIQARLNSRVRELNFDNYSQYINYVEKDASRRELTRMVDFLTTNLTYFYREPQHFDYFRQQILPKVDIFKLQDFKIWSAGCSSGEEPLTLAMSIKDFLPNTRIVQPVVLATDISHRMLDRALMGMYPEEKMKSVPEHAKNNYFYVRREDNKRVYRVNKAISAMVRFCHLNLMEKWPMTGSFDMIMCRNVMIYFDRQTQVNLVKRFYRILKPGGTLMIGHSESLTGISSEFKYVQPSVYVRPA